MTWLHRAGRDLLSASQGDGRGAALGQSDQPARSPTSDRLIRQSLLLSKVLCLVTLGLSLFTAVGWILDIPLMARGHPTLPAMQPNTALGLAFGASSILLTPGGASRSWRKVMALILAAAMLLLGVLTLGEYMFGWNLRIDHLFVQEGPIAGELFPGRPSPQTSLNFALLGTVLIRFNLGTRHSLLGQVGVIVTGANAIVAATGYIFGKDVFHGFPLRTPGIGIAVHSAIAFVLLGVALLCARPTEGLMTLVTSDTHTGGMARRIFVAGIFAPPLVGALTRLGVVAGWYDVGIQVSLFAFVMIGLILRTTWRAARRSEREELSARAALDALQRANLQLTRAVDERQRARDEIEAANRQLQDANGQITRLYEKTKELDQLKTRFFANVSHEFRTPLSLILSPIEKHLTSTAMLGSDLRRDLEIVERSAHTLLRHVDDLLDVARLDAGHLEPQYAKADASELLHSVSDHFSALAGERNIDFTVRAPAALPLEVDPDKLQRILLNLLSNGFKFTPRGGRVRTSVQEIDGRLRLEVGDSGPGIPEDKRHDVFERFHQLETPTGRSFGGTGLGLSIVKDFATLLQGHISIADAPEGGALFVLDLPLTAPPGVPVRPRTSEPADSRNVSQLVETLHEPRPVVAGDQPPEQERDGLVLVVEDNREMSRFVAESLMGGGFRVATAFDGREGYEKAIDLNPDLVLTDVMMPRMSGDELVRSLRERPDFRATPIVMLTAKVDEDFRVRLLRNGADDFVDKPFSIEELCARIRNLIARKRAEDSSNRLRKQVEDVADASKSVSEAVGSLPESSVLAVLETIALKARGLTSAEFAAVGIGSDPNRPFDTWAFAGLGHEIAAKIGRYPRPIGLLGAVAKENGGIRLRDLREHPEYRGFPPHHPLMTSFIGVPIRYRGNAVGNLYVANKRGAPEFTLQDHRVAEMLAEGVGVAIETARLYSSEGAERAWLESVVDQMPEGILLMDANGRTMVENRFLRSLAAAGPRKIDRFGNRAALDLRHPSGEPLSADDVPIVKALVNRETTQGHEFVAQRSDGRLIPLLVSAAPIRSATGELLGATMILQDVSMLKELEHLREEWAAIVAHDLQQPIQAILLRTELLLRGSLTDEQAENVRHVRTTIKRLSRMVSDLTDASQLETNRMRMTLERLDLGELVREVVQRAPNAKARTRIQIPEKTGPFVNGDAQRLEQVVGNLLANALKYGAPNADIQVEVGAFGEHARVSVTNRGPGIPADEIAGLFERYARARAAKMSATKGLGLGLYIAKGLVEAHGGRIWAESVPGQTTTFHFTVPLDKQPANALALPAWKASRTAYGKALP